MNAHISKINDANCYRDISHQNPTTWVAYPTQLDYVAKAEVRKFSNEEEEVKAFHLQSNE